MSRPELDRRPEPRSPADPRAEDETAPAADDPEEVLALLSDDHARDILRAVDGDALPACELVERVEASRATVYRRLDRLTEAGLLETNIAYHPDGHHRQEFSLALDRVELSLGADGVGIDADQPT
jgi:DNA-binding transcriptional ArsR family regulator